MVLTNFTEILGRVGATEVGCSSYLVGCGPRHKYPLARARVHLGGPGRISLRGDSSAVPPQPDAATRLAGLAWIVGDQRGRLT